MRFEEGFGLLRRREFLGRGVALGVGSVLLGSAGAARAEAPSVRSYKKLGRTGLEISDISFGSSRTTDPDLVRYALDLGVNYFDTAESYENGESESTTG